MSEPLNPIARLDRQAVSSVIVEPMVVGGGWVEVQGDGNDIVLRSTGPAGNLRPRGNCILDGEDASAFVAALAHMQDSEPAEAPATGDYIARIRTADGSELTARVPVLVSPSRTPAVVVGDRQYRLDLHELETVRRLIAVARC